MGDFQGHPFRGNQWSVQPSVSGGLVTFKTGAGSLEAKLSGRKLIVEHARAAGKSSIVLASGNPRSRERGFDSEDSKFVDAVSRSRGGVRIEGDKQGTWFAKILVSKYGRK